MTKQEMINAMYEMMKGEKKDALSLTSIGQ